MNKTKIVFGIGIALAILAVLPAMAAAAENVSYFDPQHGSADTDDFRWVTLYLNVSSGTHLAGGQMTIKFNRTHVNITDARKGCPWPPGPGDTCWGNLDMNYNSVDNGYMWGGVTAPQVWDDVNHEWDPAPGGYFIGQDDLIKICEYKVEANGTGVSPFNFGFEMFPSGCPLCQDTHFSNENGTHLEVTYENGTFSHRGPLFTKHLEPRWNLISPPYINMSNMTVANIIDPSLSGNYSALYKYNASTNSSVLMSSSDVMEYGVGYFINITNQTGADWSYKGAPTSMNVSLEQGLNMVGWLNSSRRINETTNLDNSSLVTYVSRWNATSQSYEVYAPHAPEPQTDMFNDFWMLDRGEGYFVAAKTEFTVSES